MAHLDLLPFGNQTSYEMGRNSNFSVAVHALAVLAFRDELTTSSHIAQSVNTNPVVVRRILSGLVDAGLVRSVPGKKGGFELAKPAKSIRLAQVRRAVDDNDVIRIHENPENPVCGISCNIKGVLDDVRERVETAVDRELKKTTVADVLHALQ